MMIFQEGVNKCYRNCAEFLNISSIIEVQQATEL